MSFNSPRKYILLSTKTASSSATLDFTSLISSQYQNYMVQFDNILAVTNSVQLDCLFSIDNGSNYLVTNYLSACGNYFSSASKGWFNTVGTARACLGLKIVNDPLKGGFCGTYLLYGFGQAKTPLIVGGGYLRDTGGATSSSIKTSCLNTGTTAVNAIRFKMSSGNILSGSISLYAVVN